MSATPETGPKDAKNETEFETNKRYITDIKINAFTMYFDTYPRGAPAR